MSQGIGESPVLDSITEIEIPRRVATNHIHKPDVEVSETVRWRGQREGVTIREVPDSLANEMRDEDRSVQTNQSWRRILLLIIAITVHNIPGL